MRHQIDTRASGDAAWCGDFAEHLYLDPHRSAMFVGDVAGRGPGTGQAADALRAYTRSVILSDTSLTNALHAIDDFFTRTSMSDAVPFASLFIAVSDGRTAELRYASAGHETGLLFDDAGRHRHLDPTGPILGLRAMLPSPSFGERAVPLGKLLVLVTDGITEARRFNGDTLAFFGSTGVVRAVQEARLSLRDTADAIHRAAVEHARGASLDDASVVVSTFGVHGKPARLPLPQSHLEGWSALTRAEVRVADLIASGRTNRDVAAELVVSHSTVATHARAIFGKLGVASRVELALAVQGARGS